jgi:glycosyltransferase involved in cell wall biosynthesis
MHVVHLYDGHEKVYNGRGSVPGVVWNIARTTAAHGHDVTVLERQWDGLPEEAEHEGVRFERFDTWTGADEPWTRVPYEEVTSPLGAIRLVGDRTNFAFSALRRLRRADFDVLHVHLPFAANVLSTVAPWIRDRLVYTAHLGELRLNLLGADEDIRVDGGALATEDQTQSRSQVSYQTESETQYRAESVAVSQTQPESRSGSEATTQSETEPSAPSILSVFSPDIHLARHAAHTTVLNPDIKAAFAKRGIPDARLSVIPNGVDIDRFATVSVDDRNRVRERYDLVPDHPIVFFVGTVMPRKGVAELVEALNLVVHEYGHNQVQVMLAGDTELDPSYCDAVEQSVSAYDLDANISMSGFVPEDDLPALYALADVFVVPSLEEGFGMTAIEALAAGTPVVATRTGDLPRLIDDGEHGRLVTPGNRRELASALDGMLSREAKRSRMGDQAASRAAEYAWSEVTTEFESIYKQVSR